MKFRLPFFLANRFVAGEHFSQAALKVRELNDKGLKATLSLLGENVLDRVLAEKTTHSYCELMEGIREQKLDATISIKLTMTGLCIDKGYCRDNLFIILKKAKQLNQFIRIDMEGSDYTQRTMDLYYEARELYSNHIGIVVQAYLHRTREDICRLITNNADVRLCKGAYKEPSHIALPNMTDIQEVFKEYASELLRANDSTRIATHDDMLINWVKRFTEEYNIPKKNFEFQMLYGLRQTTCEELVKQGYNVRIYVPYGTMWFPYFIRRLRERKENMWFLISTMYKK